MINSIYGILKGAAVISPETRGYRYSDTKRTTKQHAQLAGLMTETEDVAAAFIDYILKLLACSPLWPKAVRELDPNNSYDVQHPELGILPFNPMQRLLHWEKTSLPIVHPEYSYCAEDPDIDRICAKILSIVAAGDDKDGIL
jgi:hypothetical protein